MVKKVHTLFHFDTNFTIERWDINELLFKAHIQNILFDPKFKNYQYKVRNFTIGTQQTEIYGPDSEEFKTLARFYPFELENPSKRTLFFQKHILKRIEFLLNRNLIFPTLETKNLDLKEKFSILIPKVKNEDIPTMIKIFDYFNHSLIYEIQGKFYKYGKGEYNFENGLYIELFLPYCDFPKFKEVLMDLFHYLECEDYVFIDDFVPGDHIIQNILKEFELENYNPLLNLRWNETDKIWMNEKLFNEDFKKKYPDLRPKYPI
jgi:hypothetical protein